ncbi:MAG: hypothetical protein HYX38_30145 [Rhodospirillales bacterium]|nr:hypothetical protein [Rhodospirillales bacterium]
MIGRKKIVLAAIALGAANVVGPTAPAHAQDTILVCKEALAQPVAAAACAGTGVILHELFVADRPFGPNGELIKLLVAPVKIMDGNIKAAAREAGAVDQAVRASLGISVGDIKRYGLFGGPNSIFRKPFG